MLLRGDVPVPEWAQGLVSALEKCTGSPSSRNWADDKSEEEEAIGDLITLFALLALLLKLTTLDR